MKKQARDIAKTSNGKVVLVAADELKVTSSFYGSIFAEKEKINGKTEYSKIPISLLEVTKNEKKEKSCINMTDEGFFTFMNRIHRFIDCFVTAYSTNIMKMKFNNEQNWKQNKN